MVNLETFEGDDEDILEKAGVESPKKTKKSSGGKKKNKKGKKKQQGEPDKKEDL